MDTLAIDIETYSDVSLPDCGVHRYAASEQFEILLFAYSLNDEPTQIIDLASGEKIPDEIMEYLTDFELYQEVSVNGKEYLLVHGGLGNYRKDKDMEEYDLHELVWSRIDYEKSYYEDFYDYIITGHTPTLTIPGMATPASVYRKNQHIAIDCGACFEGGRLAAICLDTGEEFYSQANMQK